MEITDKRERKEKQARTNAQTIQSISLLAYLAEHHNLWGPFLVIAPASTLHNWQQELARFVPRLKALPYWGSPKDRETLRKIWSRKNMTFSEGSPFHIIVTSYQLVRLPSSRPSRSSFLLQLFLITSHIPLDRVSAFAVLTRRGLQLTTRLYKMRNTSRG
jgi:SNF2 family DNA or RNA helicase